MCVQGEASNSQRYQGYEHGESSNTQRMQEGYNGDQFGNNFQGGTGFMGNGNNMNGNNNFNTKNGNNNFKKFGNGNNSFKNSSSGFNNRNGNGSNNNYFGNMICSRRMHPAPNCYYRLDNGNVHSSSPLMCQIYGKIGHIALECYHMNNYAYQGNPPPSLAMTAQTNIESNEVVGSVFSNENGHGFSAEDNWIIDTGATHHMTASLNHLNNVTLYTGDEKITIGNGPSNKENTLPRKE
ncbi:unnamed protein product [Malus baccata var. baccata]